MLLKIEFTSDVPIYEQIYKQIIIELARGSLKKGEILPSVRQLASDLGVNLHTVNKAYQKLRDLGYVEMDRRFGSKIYDVITSYDNPLSEIGDELLYLLGDLKNRNYEKEEILALVEEVYTSMEEKHE